MVLQINSKTTYMQQYIYYINKNIQGLVGLIPPLKNFRHHHLVLDRVWDSTQRVIEDFIFFYFFINFVLKREKRLLSWDTSLWVSSLKSSCLELGEINHPSRHVVDLLEHQ